jgi:uncharacterized membrane protein YfcA
VSGGAGVTIPLDVLLLVPLVIFAAYLVFGITGFGASPITIPVLGLYGIMSRHYSSGIWI